MTSEISEKGGHLTPLIQKNTQMSAIYSVDCLGDIPESGFSKTSNVRNLWEKNRAFDRDRMMKSQTDIVVIGGGIAGCSTLYHLTREGITDCVLVERDELTLGTTWHSAAQVTNFGPNQTMLGLKTHWLSLQAVCVHVMFFVKSEGWIDMDHKQFQEWLSGIDHLSPAQRQQTEAVFLGDTETSASLAAPLKRPWVEIASARIVARQAPYRVARQGVCDGTSAKNAGRHSMPRPAPPCGVCTARTGGLPSEPVLPMG